MTEAAAGLDCIAMAVAHLERSTQPPQSSADEKDCKGAPPALVPAVPFRTQPRVVSYDGQNDGTGVDDACPFPEHSERELVPEAALRLSRPAPNAAGEVGKAGGLRDVLSHLDLKELNSIAIPDPKLVISEVRDDDVLCGRGGMSNHHSGNMVSERNTNGGSDPPAFSLLSDARCGCEVNCALNDCYFIRYLSLCCSAVLQVLREGAPARLHRSAS